MRITNRTPFVLVAALLLAGPAAAQQMADLGTDAPPLFEETVEVELVSVPFYAVDADGAPVYDLAPEEIELRLDGEPVALDHLDRYGAPEAALARHGESSATPERLLPPSLPRHVLFLFDQAFSTPRGLTANRQAAQRLLDQLPETDWLYLVTYHSQEGFEQRLGPLAADAEGRRQVAESLAALKPNVERIRIRSDLQKIALTDCKKCFASDNVEDAYRDIHATEQANYLAEARAMADAMGYLAAFVRQLKGPRLVLFFSGGMDSRLYTDGLAERAPPARMAFEAPLRELGESGAMTLFVNADTHADAGHGEETEFVVDADALFINNLPRGETTLAEMSAVAGGMVLQHTNTRTLADRISDWTGAYYEAGFYGLPAGERGRHPQVELKVLRPGVRAWSPKWVKARRELRELSRREKRFLLADLVLHGPQGHAAREVAGARFSRLDGRFGGAAEPGAAQASADAGSRRLVFSPAWPEELRFRALETYSLVLEPATEGGAGGRLVSFREGIVSPGGASWTFDVTLPGEGSYLWGIVALDPDDGAVYLRRLKVDPEPAATQAAAAPDVAGTGR